jgi:hypothetical protein
MGGVWEGRGRGYTTSVDPKPYPPPRGHPGVSPARALVSKRGWRARPLECGSRAAGSGARQVVGGRVGWGGVGGWGGVQARLTGPTPEVSPFPEETAAEQARTARATRVPRLEVTCSRRGAHVQGRHRAPGAYSSPDDCSGRGMASWPCRRMRVMAPQLAGLLPAAKRNGCTPRTRALRPVSGHYTSICKRSPSRCQAWEDQDRDQGGARARAPSCGDGTNSSKRVIDRAEGRLLE